MTDLRTHAQALMASGKGILAADESVASADKRLALYGIEGSAETRRKFRDLFLNAPGSEDYLSGVILFSETLGQKGDDGVFFPLTLAKRGIAPGIKVDEGTEPIPESPKELITKGLIGLPERLAEFAKSKSVFTKWRAVVRIEGDQLPTAHAILENAKRLAAYARDVQTAGLVPILEPEVLLEGAHSRIRSQEVLQMTLTTLFSVLAEQSVDLSGIILKTAMAISGSASGKKDTPEEVAHATVETLMATVPRDVPGIVFLSGGQTPDQATDNLRAIARAANAAKAPWPLTFSYARALQEEALEVWQGKEENVALAREAFLARLKKVSTAARGE
ncbi:MAG TPA: class I fructose-bisphosphate aldolase [Candidatus Paceibacterota bacterium]|nr:class I fructose-bisphosphate aldolase [Candidatus Paceibacterota bacterium]